MHRVTMSLALGIRTISRGGAIYSFLHFEDEFPRYETIIFEPSIMIFQSVILINPSFLNDEFKQLCRDIYLPFVTDFKTFKNIFSFYASKTVGGSVTKLLAR